MSGDVHGYHRKILREGILREGAERWGGGRGTEGGGVGGGRGKVCGGRGARSEQEERERERGEKQQMRSRLTVLYLTPRGSLTGQGLNMTITAAPQHKAPFPVCFVFYGDGPASHRGGKGFIGLTCVLLNQIVRTTD